MNAAHVEESDAIEEQGFSYVLGCVGAIPLFSYLALFLFACLAWVKTGHWPSYGNPDPKHLAIGLIVPLWIAIAAAALAVPTYALLFAGHTIHRRWQFSPADRVGLAAWVSGILLWTFAASGLLNWLAD